MVQKLNQIDSANLFKIYQNSWLLEPTNEDKYPIMIN